MITAEGIKGAAYVGDHQPVSLYAGAHKVAGWHSQTVSGTGTISIDGAYNVPPDALVIDGRCEQTVGVWGTNLITNGNFSNGTTGWVNAACNFSSITDSRLSFIGSGANRIFGIYQAMSPATQEGHKYYQRFTMRTFDDGCEAFSVSYNGAPAALIVSPAKDTIYTLSRVWTQSSSTYNLIYAQSKWADAAAAAGKTCDVGYVLALDLTAAFGAGNEPTAEQMDAYLAAYPNSWFDGSALLTTSGTPNSPSPTYPAPITSITGDLTITGADGDLSDTATIPLGAVELCSLPDGTKDEYDAVAGVVTKRVGKAVFDGNADEVWEIHSVNGYGIVNFRISSANTPTDLANFNQIGAQTFYLNDLFPQANTPIASTEVESLLISNRSIYIRIATTRFSTVAELRSFLSAQPLTIFYLIATPYTIQLTPDLPVVRTGIKTLTVSANITPSFTATVKAMDD